MEKMNFTPHNRNVLVEVTELPTTVDGVYIGEQALASKTNIEFYYGQALKLGESAHEECPGLKEGDLVIFSQFGGHHLKTDDGFCKVVRAGNIVATAKDFKDMRSDNVYPTWDRILVEIIGEKLIDEDGIYNEDLEDPREAVTQKGKVISCGANALQFEPGTIVLFDPYCGNLIVNENDLKLKTINSFDVLVTLPKK